jgi:CDGSH-type Zn-finger protein
MTDDWGLVRLYRPVNLHTRIIAMAEVKIRMRPNGPFVVEGPFELVDSRGQAFAISADKPAVALCRCGDSQNKPFCDGAHKSCGFESDETPPEPVAS